MGLLTLRDNSKLIVNAIDQAEAERVIQQCSAVINSALLTGLPPKIGPRGGESLAEIEVHPRIMRFFVDGQRNVLPTWEKYLY